MRIVRLCHQFHPLVVLLALLTSSTVAFAQHQHGTAPTTSQPEQKQDQSPKAPNPDPHAGMDMGRNQHMSMGGPATEAVAQYGSGTSWRPASTPENMWMTTTASGWTLMAHANVFLSYNQQGGPAGTGKLESPNWVMLMEQHGLGRARLQLRQMLSAEPITAPKPGFPEIFQTGETRSDSVLTPFARF